MTERANRWSIRRRQLDLILARLSPHSGLVRPREGWIHEIRNSLGMSAEQLAARVDVRTSTVFKMERTEAEDAISLRSLRKLAQGMNCTLVYAIVPNESLEHTLLAQARRQALLMVGRVEGSMRLESQGRSQEALEAEVEELAAELVRTLSRDLWREKAEG